MSRHQTKVAVHLLFVAGKDANNILLLRRDNTGYFDGCWGVPAGHVEPGEFPLHAAIREAWEEVGLTLDPRDLSLELVMHHIKPGDATDYTHYFFKVRSWTGTAINKEPDKCSSLDWTDFGILHSVDVIPYIAQAIDGYNQGRRYMEFMGL